VPKEQWAELPPQIHDVMPAWLPELLAAHALLGAVLEYRDARRPHTAQDVAGTTHAATITRWATKLVDDAPNKQYLYVGLNRSLRTMVDEGADGKRLVTGFYSKHRPDILAVYWDPVARVPKVEFYEVPSAGQGANELVQKMRAAMNNIPAAYRTIVTAQVNVIPKDPA
jgi:hypothetical protein